MIFQILSIAAIAVCGSQLTFSRTANSLTCTVDPKALALVKQLIESAAAIAKQQLSSTPDHTQRVLAWFAARADEAGDEMPDIDYEAYAAAQQQSEAIGGDEADTVAQAAADAVALPTAERVTAWFEAATAVPDEAIDLGNTTAIAMGLTSGCSKSVSWTTLGGSEVNQ